ncbi:hypothetical protein OJAV_G00235620 [Oryzias javanicus]|uniref:Uncharacterized protein n=1 Tax=Oryzias javanicus TaxID=123683 RepID=A0A3S2P976_ORYJA|nr:hypothetical protein OJAV_G00235620 [Oryzias javanicus]
MTQKNPAVFSGSSDISPSPGAGQKTTSKLSLRKTFQLAQTGQRVQPKPSAAGTSTEGKAVEETPAVQPPPPQQQRKKHHHQQQRQTPNSSFPPKQSVQKPPHLQPQPEPQLQTPVPQNTQQPNEDPPLPEAQPENQAGAEFQTPGGVQTTSSAKGRRRATALNTVGPAISSHELENITFEATLDLLNEIAEGLDTTVSEWCETAPLQTPPRISLTVHLDSPEPDFARASRNDDRSSEWYAASPALSLSEFLQMGYPSRDYEVREEEVSLPVQTKSNEKTESAEPKSKFALTPLNDALQTLQNDANPGSSELYAPSPTPSLLEFLQNGLGEAEPPENVPSQVLTDDDEGENVCASPPRNGSGSLVRTEQTPPASPQVFSGRLRVGEESSEEEVVDPSTPQDAPASQTRRVVSERFNNVEIRKVFNVPDLGNAPNLAQFYTDV